MVATNGSKRSLSELLAEVERFDREAEIELEVQKRVEARLAEHRAEERRQAEAQMRGVRRSQLSAKEKSDIISMRGKAFYDSLPW